MAYQWFKAFHIVGIVCWFAGLFYLPRLFVYHAEANEQPEPARSILKNQYQIMEKRLYRIIMTPALLLTITMAIGLVYTEPDVLKQPWLQIKLGCVALLIVYDHLCLRIMKRLAADTCKMTGQQFRWFNEFPTVLFVIVVMLAVFKNDIPTGATAWGIFGMVVAMGAFIQLYARKRRLAREQLAAAPASEASA
ncbi:protoporphyrinogen oxidase HemJ [Cyanobacteria bacterium FACHB-63]|nr:protoporphyrinogen oxidase HemJ [Cyanobacteria bacterium FACHB-63]